MSTTAAVSSTCAACGEAASTTLKLQRCTACRSVAYCGRDCQLAHWKQHKRRCKAIKAERSAEAAKRIVAAVYGRDLAGLKKLMVSEGGASVDAFDAKGWTALLVAACRGLLDFVVVLVDKGDNLDLAMESGATPVYMAAQNGHHEAVCLLADNGASLDLAREDGTTPVLMASQNGHHEVVGVLADKGANLDLAMEDGCTPVLMAAEKGHHEGVRR